VTSAQGRAILFMTAMRLIASHWFSGVGVFQTNVMLGNASGLQNVSHNSYLEVVLIGGVWGIMFLAAYAYIVLAALRIRAMGRDALQADIEALVQVVIVIAIAGLFLSLAYNSILWLPLILALSIGAWNPRSIRGAIERAV
jgi:hypothetical protein